MGLPRKMPVVRTTIGVAMILAGALVRAAPDSATQLIPAGAPLPAFTLEDPHDFDALREAWGRRLDYHALCEETLPTDAWAEAEKAEDYAKAYEIASKWLATCPVVERVHLWAYGDAQHLGDASRMDIHKRWYQGLIQSVLKTGDGKSPETAWKTISVPEEYAVLQYFGLVRGTQALVTHPVMIDKLTAKPRAGGDPVDLYFNPELHFARLAHELGMK